MIITNDSLWYYTELNRDDAMAPQPARIVIQMFEHQLRTVAYALSLESGLWAYPDENISSNVGVLCDSVGAGKSYIALAIASNDIDKMLTYDAAQYVAITTTNQHNGVNLFVVPHSLVNQWKDYCANTTMETTVISKKKEIADAVLTEITIVTSTQYKDFCNQDFGIFKRVFYDEADTIRLTNCQRVRSLMTWFITAGIDNITSRMDDYCRPCKDGIIMHTTGYIRDTLFEISKCSHRARLFVRNVVDVIDYKVPSGQAQVLQDFKHITIPCAATASRILENIVSSSVIDMIHAGDIQGVVEQLNIEQTNGDNILTIICSNLINKKETLKARIESFGENTLLSYSIKELDRKIGLVRERLASTNICPISFDEIKTPTIVKCCNNKFDFESITKYMHVTPSAKCPFCRTKLKPSLLVVVTSGEEETKEEEVVVDNTDNYWNSREHTGIENTIHILRELPSGSRVLVFAEFDRTFEIIGTLTDADAIRSKCLLGTAANQANTIQWFSEESTEVRVLLLNSVHIGDGVNLQMASDVILVHNMSVSMRQQCIGRAQRYCRTGVLNVYEMDYSA